MMKRRIRIDGDIAYIPLTKGYEAIIDAADVHLVDGWNWSARVQPNAVYAVRNDCSGPKPRLVKMHRVLMGEPDGLEIDHRDSDGLNNRRGNLREATRAQNQRNTRIRRDNMSGFKGVGWSSTHGKWQARICVDGKSWFLGRYDTPEAAHARYVSASQKLHGEFARAG